MKIIGFIMKNKLITAIIVIAIIVILALSTMSVYDWEEGAPEANITCSIQAINGTDLFSGDIDVADISELDGLSVSKPLTSFYSDISGIDALTSYNIEFTAEMTTKTAKFGEPLTNTITATGITGGANAGRDYLGFTGLDTIAATVEGTAGASSTLVLPPFTQHTTADSIMGDVIDGSVFNFIIKSEATDGRTSQTTASLTLTVTDGGTIYIELTGISTVVVGGDSYPTGWNVPGDANYMVITYDGGSYVMNYNNILYGDTLVAEPQLSRITDEMSILLSANEITQIQYDMANDQIEALEVI